MPVQIDMMVSHNEIPQAQVAGSGIAGAVIDRKTGEVSKIVYGEFDTKEICLALVTLVETIQRLRADLNNHPLPDELRELMDRLEVLDDL